jgi:hypothetical protein
LEALFDICIVNAMDFADFFEAGSIGKTPPAEIFAFGLGSSGKDVDEDNFGSEAKSVPPRSIAIADIDAVRNFDPAFDGRRDPDLDEGRSKAGAPSSETLIFKSDHGILPP